MTNGRKTGLWLGAVLAAATGTMMGACGNSDTTENATTSVSQAVEETSDASDAADVANLARGLNGLRSEAVEGFHCDASPDTTYVDVCGQSLPSTVHLEWTSCAQVQHPNRGGPGGGGDGTRPPPPDGGMPPAGGGGPRGGEGHGGRDFHGGPSAGTVDIAYSYPTPDDCAAGVTQNQTATFSITRTAEDGSTSKVEGTTSSSALLVADAPPQQKETQADVTRTRTDSSGAVVKSVHLTGSMSVAFSSDTPPTRTINGSYKEAFLDGTEGTVTLTDIVRPARNVCQWPTSGTLTRVTSSGETHTLVFGPDCGTATLDGTAVDLPERGGKGPLPH